MGKRWTTLLQNKLGSEYYVASEGMNGRTTAYDRGDQLYRNGLSSLWVCMATHKPLDYVIFMLGTNDCNKELGLTSKQIAEGMEELLLKAFDFCKHEQAYMPQFVIVVPPAIGDNYRNSVFAASLNEVSYRNSREIAPLYKELADKYGCMYLDCTDKIKVSDIDSEHLPEESHRKLADLIYELIVYEG